jgi:hypothetical protein
MELMLDDVVKSKAVKPRKGRKREYTGQQLGEILHDHVNRHGGGFFSDFWDGFKKGFSGVMNVAKPVLSLIPHPAAQSASKVLGAVGFGKRGRKKKAGACTAGAMTAGATKGAGDDVGGACTAGALTGAAMTGSGKGKGKGNTKRIEIVKKIMKQKKMSMIQASKYVKEHGLYKK